MDAAWAVVVGSAIGALGTLGGTAFTSYIADNRQRAHQRREELRLAIEVIVLALVKYAGAQRRSAEATEEQLEAADAFFAAQARLGLLLEKGDGEVITVLLGTFAAITTKPEMGSRLVADIAEYLPAWFRREATLNELALIKAKWPIDLMKERYDTIK